VIDVMGRVYDEMLVRTRSTLHCFSSRICMFQLTPLWSE